MARLESPERRRLIPTDLILGVFGLGPSETVVDVGAGIGLFSFEAARLVGPSGKVLALDTSEEMLAELGRRIEASGLSNLAALRSREYEFPLESTMADLVILSTVLHEVDEPRRLLEEISRILKPGGRIGIVEWQPEGPPVGGAPGQAEGQGHEDGGGPDHGHGGGHGHGHQHGGGRGHPEWLAPATSLSHVAEAGFGEALLRELNERVYLVRATKTPGR